MASAERTSAPNGHHGQKNECARDRKVMHFLYFPTVIVAVCVMRVGSELVRLADWIAKGRKGGNESRGAA
jgi:hypothetical protein